MGNSALITGGSSGIGLAYARYLDSLGWSLDLAAQSQDRLLGAGALLQGKAGTHSLDLASPRAQLVLLGPPPARPALSSPISTARPSAPLAHQLRSPTAALHEQPPPAPSTAASRAAVGAKQTSFSFLFFSFFRRFTSPLYFIYFTL